MSETCTHDCSTCGANCASREPESLLKPSHPQSHVKKVIGVVSGKGGVGKSLVSSMLAVAMRRAGFKTAVMDADITGPSIPKAFGVHTKAMGEEGGIFPERSANGTEIISINMFLEDESDPVVWRGPVIAGMVTQFWTDVIWGDVDFMFVDMPPGTGDVPLTIFQSLPVDGVVVVTSPQELVGQIVEKCVRMAEMMNVPVLGLVENMSYFVCPDGGEKHEIFGVSHVAEAAQQHGIDTVCRIPMDSRLAANMDAGEIEQFEGEWLQPLVNKLSGMVKEAK